MTNIVLNDITSGYNISKLNSNFQILEDSINNDVLNLSGGNNTLLQDIDLNSNNLLNVKNLDADRITINGKSITLNEFVLGDNVVGSSNLVDGAVTEDKLGDGSVTEVKLADGAVTNIKLGDHLDLAKMDFLQTGTDAVVSSAKEKLQRILELLDFVDPSNHAGALDGSFDVSPALNAALDEALSRGQTTVRLPPGKLRLNSTISKTISGINGISIEGAGMGLTKLICYDPSGSGISIEADSGNWWMDVSPSATFRFAHFSICSTSLNTGTGIQINGGATTGRPAAPCIFDHVETRQLNTINGQAFANGVRLVDTADSHFSDCRFFSGGISNTGGNGVRIGASGPGVDPTEHHFVNCKWYYGSLGVFAEDYVEGLWFSNCTIVGLDNAVKYSTTTSESGLGWMGGHINTKSYAFNLAKVFDVEISGALIYASSAVLLEIGSNVTITGNTFYGGDASGTAINIHGATGDNRGSTISGNQFSSFTNGILIDSASHNVTVGLNGFSNVSTRVSNSSSDSYVAPRVFAGSTVKTLVGGAVTELIDIPVPSGAFSGTATNGTLQAISPLTYDLIGFYAYGDAAQSATNARFRVVRRDGSNLPSGGFRFGFSIFGN